jgi:hypothetical protein
LQELSSSNVVERVGNFVGELCCKGSLQKAWSVANVKKKKKQKEKEKEKEKKNEKG